MPQEIGAATMTALMGDTRHAYGLNGANLLSHIKGLGEEVDSERKALTPQQLRAKALAALAELPALTPEFIQESNATWRHVLRDLVQDPDVYDAVLRMQQVTWAADRPAAAAPPAEGPPVTYMLAPGSDLRVWLELRDAPQVPHPQMAGEFLLPDHAMLTTYPRRDRSGWEMGSVTLRGRLVKPGKRQGRREQASYSLPLDEDSEAPGWVQQLARDWLAGLWVPPGATGGA